jgi:hypothetical protein
LFGWSVANLLATAPATSRGPWVEGPICAFQAAPALVCERNRLFGRPLNYRDQLDVLGLEVISEEAVDVERMIGVCGVDRAKDVCVNLMLLEAIPAANYVVEGTLVALADAIGVMQGARSVDADPDEVVVPFEKLRPFVVDQRAVGLDGVKHAQMWSAVLLRELHGAAEKIEAPQHRLAALPGHFHLRPGRGFQQLPNVCLKQVICHQQAFALRIEILLGQEKAVLTT